MWNAFDQKGTGRIEVQVSRRETQVNLSFLQDLCATLRWAGVHCPLPSPGGQSCWGAVLGEQKLRGLCRMCYFKAAECSVWKFESRVRRVVE